MSCEQDYTDTDVFGTTELCAWRYFPGVCRFQTRSPEFARKLGQRSNAQLVAWSVTGDYLRIFQERIEPWRARQLVTRYLTPTNGAFSERISPLNRSRASLKVLRAKDARRHDNSRFRLKTTDFPQLESVRGYR